MYHTIIIIIIIIVPITITIITLLLLLLIVFVVWSGLVAGLYVVGLLISGGVRHHSQVIF